MTNLPLSETGMVEDIGFVSQIRRLPPSDIELNLLLEWPREHSRAEWLVIAAVSVTVNLLLIWIGVLLAQIKTKPWTELEQQHITWTPLYMPPDILTQKAPNREKVAKAVDLEDLLASRRVAPRSARPIPSRGHVEIPRQAPRQQIAKTIPQILPATPKPVSKPVPQPGSPAGVIARKQPTPPTPAQNPFQDVGSEAAVNPHPTLAPPKVEQLAPVQPGQTDRTKVAVSDDNRQKPMPGALGTIGQQNAEHAAVELKSDPQNADFRAYLTRILAIVRKNWRTVTPESVRIGAVHGCTVVEFAIDRDGNIPKMVLAGSSGLDSLDRAAVAGLSMSNPLPALPGDYRGLQVKLAFSFSYNLPKGSCGG